MKKDKPIKLCLFALYTELWVVAAAPAVLVLSFVFITFYKISSDFAIQTQPSTKVFRF